ncbi:MAG: hypothetical protein WA071_05155 [Undibacterium umbellatum]|uniref:hypothetical protein n=1 Tax=Undibacterium umbellatum TaxID=2762300 RepID=UPI003BB4FA4C
MRAFKSKYFKNIDFISNFGFLSEALPIYESIAKAYDHFNFQGWEKVLDEIENNSETEQLEDNFSDAKLATLPKFDDPEYRTEMEKVIAASNERSQKIVDDLDVLVEIGILNSATHQSKYREKNTLKNKLLEPIAKIPHDYADKTHSLHTTYWFLEWENEYWDSDDDEFSFNLPSNRIANIINLNGAMALFALEQATSSALRNEVWATSHLLLSGTKILSLTENMLTSEYDYVVKSRHAKKGGKARHMKTYEIKKFALEKATIISSTYPHLSTNQIVKRIFPDVQKFAMDIGQPLMERGIKTIYEWLLAEKNTPSAKQT